jgi:hypothetical protein
MFARTERPEHRGRTSSRTLRGQLGMIGPRLRCSLCFVCRKEKACASERDAGQPPAGRWEAAQSGASRTTLAAEVTAVSDEGGWGAIIVGTKIRNTAPGTGRRHWATRQKARTRHCNRWSRFLFRPDFINEKQTHINTMRTCTRKTAMTGTISGVTSVEGGSCALSVVPRSPAGDTRREHRLEEIVTPGFEAPVPVRRCLLSPIT